MTKLPIIAAAVIAVSPHGAQLLMQKRTPVPPPLPSVAQLLAAAPVSLVVNTSLVNQRLAWDTVTQPGVAGYRLYYGTNPPPYAFTNNVGNVTTAVASNLVRGATYSFSITDYLTNGLESAFSPALVATVPWFPPATNVLGVSVRVWSRPAVTEPWTLFVSMPVWTGTNTTGTEYFQCDMAITQTNLSKQVLRLDSHTLIVTNR